VLQRFGPQLYVGEFAGGAAAPTAATAAKKPAAAPTAAAPKPATTTVPTNERKSVLLGPHPNKFGEGIPYGNHRSLINRKMMIIITSH
jgi:hypothetical protein